MKNPQSIVAIILAVSVLVFIGGGLIAGLLRDDTPQVEIAELWGDIIKVIIGGLIAYIGISSVSK